MANLEPDVWRGPDVGAPKNPLTARELDAFRNRAAALSAERRAQNKALRLRHAASANDGLTVYFLKTCDEGVAGETTVVASSHAAHLIAAGYAESAE